MRLTDPAAEKAAKDRQRKLNEMCRAVLSRFVGRDITPTLIAEAEGELRHALSRAVEDGTYVLPSYLELDKVELGDDLRIKVFFKKCVDERLVSIWQEIEEEDKEAT